MTAKSIRFFLILGKRKEIIYKTLKKTSKENNKGTEQIRKAQIVIWLQVTTNSYALKN